MDSVASLPAEQLLRFPVRLDGMDVGRPVDLIIDPEGGRAVGLDVLCRDDVHRFLPLAAAEVDGEEIRLGSAFTLLDEAGFEFYRARTSSLRTLKGTQVARAGKKLGLLRDVVVSTAGAIEAFIVQSPDGARSIRAEPGISLVGNGRNGSG
jgi:hypothetical protein